MRRAAIGLGVLVVLAVAAVAVLPASAMPRLAMERGLLQLAGRHVKWGEPRYGSGAVVRWAYVSEPVSDPAARNCRDMLPMDGLVERLGADMAQVDLEIRAAFRVWSDAAAVRFRRVRNMNDADILIGVQADDRGVAYANVTEHPGAGGAVVPIGRSAVCFDAGERWELEADGDKDTYRLRYVAAHEIGHAIGLDHLGRKGGLMGFSYDGADEHEVALSAADLAAVRRLYGAPPSLTATPVPLATGCAVGDATGACTNVAHRPGH